MFKLQPKPTFWAKAKISIPGEAQPSEIEVQFKHLGRQGLKDYFASLEGSEDDVKALSEIMVGWKGIDAEFSVETLAQLVDNYPSSAKAIFETYSREALDVRAKN
jgi:hypothetical protein